MEKVSQPVRIFALVAALAALGGALFMFTQSRGAGEVAPIPVPQPTPPATPPKVAKAPVTPSKPKPVKAAAKPAKPAPKPASKPATKSAPALPATGFPVAVDRALAKHEVVVLSLVVPGSRVDELAAAEARAGAEAGGVGYLALNVLNEGVAHALLTKLEGVQDPSLLVVRRPGEVVLHLPGFVDRQTVAQAAANASS
jgi:outer membrane biosynthesis protein TonB